MSLIQQCLTPWALVINQVVSHPCAEIYSAELPTTSVAFVQYLPIFIKTLAFELPFYYFFLRPKFSMLKILWINFIINVATHPFIFLMLPSLLVRFEFSYLQYLVIAEIFAPAVEAVLLNRFFKLSWSRAITAALVANLFSWSIGVLLN